MKCIAFGIWPPLPQCGLRALIDAAGNVSFANGATILGVTHVPGSGVYVVSFAPGIFGDTAAVTVVPGTTAVGGKATGVFSQFTITLVDQAGTPADGSFFLELFA